MNRTTIVIALLLGTLFGCKTDELRPDRRSREQARRDSALITGEPMDCAGPDKIVVEETDACGTVTSEKDNPEPYVCVVRGLIVLCPRKLSEPCAFSEVGPTMYTPSEDERP